MKAVILDLETRSELIVMNPEDEDPRDSQTNMAQIRFETKRRLVQVIRSPMVPKGSIGLPPSLANSMGVSEGSNVAVFARRKPISLPLIKKKYMGKTWTHDDIRTIVDDMYQGNVTDQEMTMFTLAMQYENLSIDETEHLTKVFTLNSETIEFSEPVYDKHSIGGIPGNKVSLLIVPIVAAAGLLIPKTSSRAITSPSGTADTFEVLANVKFTSDEIQDIAPKTRGMLVWGGQLNLAPVDSEIITRVERPLSLDPESVIIASILSKKLATGVKHMVLDMPVGPGTKMATREEAQNLSRLFVEIGRRVGIQVECALTYADQPVGHAIGPALEAREAVVTLMGKGPRSVLEKSIELSGILFEMAGMASRGKGNEIAAEIVKSGKALSKFNEIVHAQGGAKNVKPEEIEIGQYTGKIVATDDGYISRIFNTQIKGMAAALGCPQDKKSGLILHRKQGEFVKKGDVIVELFTTRESALDRALQVANVKAPWLLEGMVLERISDSGNFEIQ